jgi:hypothetical protein
MQMTEAPPNTIPMPVLMGVDEARGLIQKVNACVNEAKWALLELEEREGWKALGYSSWRECAAQEFKLSERHVYRLLTIAKVSKRICLAGQTVQLSERVAEQLNKYPEEKQKKIYRKSLEYSEGEQITADDIRETAAEMGLVSGPRMTINVKCTLCNFPDDDELQDLESGGVGLVNTPCPRSDCKGHIIYRRGRAILGAVAFSDKLGALASERKELFLLYLASELGHTKSAELLVQAEKAEDVTGETRRLRERLSIE